MVKPRLDHIRHKIQSDEFWQRHIDSTDGMSMAKSAAGAIRSPPFQNLVKSTGLRQACVKRPASTEKKHTHRKESAEKKHRNNNNKYKKTVLFGVLCVFVVFWFIFSVCHGFVCCRFLEQNLYKTLRPCILCAVGLLIRIINGSYSISTSYLGRFHSISGYMAMVLGVDSQLCGLSIILHIPLTTSNKPLISINTKTNKQSIHN
jgi:hypothetical protein